MPSVSQQLSCRRIAVAIVIALGAGCDSGPSDSEFVNACLAEGERGANKMMRREMGVKGEDFCKCGAREARSALSPRGPASHGSGDAGQEGGSARNRRKDERNRSRTPT